MLYIIFTLMVFGVRESCPQSISICAENANKKHTGALNNSIQALNEATNRLNLKLILIFCQHVCRCDDGVHFGYLLIRAKQRRN